MANSGGRWIRVDLELRHLRAITVIAEAGSVSQAASRLGTAQPALTAQLRRIEKIIGGQLFERSRQGVRATALGNYVLERARVILADTADLHTSANSFEHADSQVTALRLGAFPSAPLTQMLPGIRELFPEAEIVMQTDMSNGNLVDLVADGVLDMVLLRELRGANLPRRREVHAQVVVPLDPAFVCMPESHPLADLDEIDLSQLDDAEWILSSPGEGEVLSQFRAACQAHGFSPKVTAYAGDTGHIEKFVGTGQGVALVGSCSVDDRGYVVRPLRGAGAMSRRWLLVWRVGSPVAAVGEDVLELVVDVFRQAYTETEPTASWFARHPEAFPGLTQA